MKRVLIAGCGKIGTELGVLLAQQGHEVFGLKRTVNQLPNQIQPVCANLSAAIAAEVLPKKITDVVYILAAHEFTPKAYQRAYVTGVKNLLTALGDQVEHLKRFIFVSSSSVYGQNQGEWVNEQSITKPKSFNGEIMLAAEKQVLDLSCGLVVRFSGIYGPGRNRMLQSVESGEIAAKDPVIYSNRIHSHDCVGVLDFLLQKPTMSDRVILASDHCPAALHEIQTWLADQMQIPKERRRMLVPNRRAGSKRLDSARLRQLGYRFQYCDYRMGYSYILKS